MDILNGPQKSIIIKFYCTAFVLTNQMHSSANVQKNENPNKET